jgi:hypothetical protein
MEINEIEKELKKVNENKIWFFTKIKTIDKLLGSLIKKKREKIQITRIRNKRL